MPSNITAAHHLKNGIHSYTRWRADAMGHFDAAIAADANSALPKLVKAWILQGARDSKFTGIITGLVDQAERSLPATQGYEHNLLAALQLSRMDKGVESATELEIILHQDPTNLLVHQLLHENLFWMGQSAWMRDVIERAIPAWDETSPDYGPFLSLRAFANEEAGYLQDAERFARVALEIDPSDIWGAHAAAHALYMKGEVSQGIELVESLSSNWGQANQMRHHMWWHLCLFLLEQGDHERILQLLTTEIRAPHAEMVLESPAASIDIQNVSSMLLRLELYGVDVGDHWQVLASICAERVNNHGNPYGNVHDMMVLVATGQDDAANELLASIQRTFESKSGAEAMAYNIVGVPACKAIWAHRSKDYAQVLELLRNCPEITSRFIQPVESPRSSILADNHQTESSSSP